MGILNGRQIALERVKTFLKWMSYIGGTLTVLSFVAKAHVVFNFGVLEPIAAILGEYYFQIWSVTVTVIVLTLLLWAWFLNRRFTSGFSDNFVIYVGELCDLEEKE